MFLSSWHCPSGPHQVLSLSPHPSALHSLASKSRATPLFARLLSLAISRALSASLRPCGRMRVCLTTRVLVASPSASPCPPCFPNSDYLQLLWGRVCHRRGWVAWARAVQTVGRLRRVLAPRQSRILPGQGHSSPPLPQRRRGRTQKQQSAPCRTRYKHQSGSSLGILRDFTILSSTDGTSCHSAR